MTRSHNYRFVGLSIFTVVFASFLALDLAGRVMAAYTTARGSKG